jgi:hypothetical protein
MQANDGKSSATYGIVLGLMVVALTGMIGTIGLLRQVGDLGPKLGDIISFDPAEPFSSDLSMRVAASAANGIAGTACVLDVRAMHAGGGSIVIEARQPKPSNAYRVHWAGKHSSDDSSDCGTSADVLLNLEASVRLRDTDGAKGLGSQPH